MLTSELIYEDAFYGDIKLKVFDGKRIEIYMLFSSC